MMTYRNTEVRVESENSLDTIKIHLGGNNKIDLISYIWGWMIRES